MGERPENPVFSAVGTFWAVSGPFSPTPTDIWRPPGAGRGGPTPEPGVFAHVRFFVWYLFERSYVYSHTFGRALRPLICPCVRPFVRGGAGGGVGASAQFCGFAANPQNPIAATMGPPPPPAPPYIYNIYIYERSQK